ncbi:hypothetical protein MUU74_17705 [Chryseobacterium daecheongense]|uniref:hypothetical protein n=1 Tax=Chryseobacterium TaxID=59732 RepID=UPI001296809D|nr:MULTISPECIES: hypothetical protein [Chryseobacterium]UMQ43320.1 hypothetical protein MKS83_06390 [Chryseobacterium sp. Y16C]UOU98313.1 hypothetical protein MUU74_17705 [Chryseobacterium daecheongense]
MKPTIYNIEAYEDTEILMISQEGIKEMTKVTAFNELTKRLDMNHGIAMQNRVNNAISLPAVERYNNLFKTHPACIVSGNYKRNFEPYPKTKIIFKILIKPFPDFQR